MDLSLEVLDEIKKQDEFTTSYELTIKHEGRITYFRFFSDSMRKTIEDKINSRFMEKYGKELTNEKMEQVFDFIGSHELMINESIKSVKNMIDRNLTDYKLTGFDRISIDFVDFSFDDSFVVINCNINDGLKQFRFMCSLFDKTPIEKMFNVVTRQINGNIIGNRYYSDDTYESFSRLYEKILNDKRLHYHLTMAYNNMLNKDKFKSIYKVSIIKS